MADKFNIADNYINKNLLGINPNAPYAEEIKKWNLYFDDIIKVFSNKINNQNKFRFYHYCFDKSSDTVTIFSCKDVSALFLCVYYIATMPYQYRHFVSFVKNYRQYLSHDEWYYLFVLLLVRDDVKLDVLDLICQYQDFDLLYYKPTDLNANNGLYADIGNNYYDLSKRLAYFILKHSQSTRALLNRLDDEKILLFNIDYLSYQIAPVEFTGASNAEMALRRKMVAIFDAKSTFTLGDQVTYASCLFNQISSLVDRSSLRVESFDEILELLQLALKKDDVFLSFLIGQYANQLLESLVPKAFIRNKFELVHLLLEKYHCLLRTFDIPFLTIMNYPEEIAYLRRYYTLQKLD